jgi:NAD(P)-dependent dehydrogenase (short-subunit alcohol dehydrogenase family)
MRRDLAGTVVLVTGAAGGLGAALCRLRSPPPARASPPWIAMRPETGGAGRRTARRRGEALAIPGDITDPAAGKDCGGAAPWHASARSTA